MAEQAPMKATPNTAVLASGAATLLRQNERFVFVFDSSDKAAEFVSSIASLLYNSALNLVITSTKRTKRDDLTASEIRSRVEAGTVSGLEITLMLDHVQADVAVTKTGEQSAEVILEVPFQPLVPAERFWVQCDPDVLTQIRMLALPVISGAFTVEAIHGFVGLCTRIGGFQSASVMTADGTTLEWQGSRTSPKALPIKSSINDTTWSVADEDDPSAQAWFFGDLSLSRTSPDEVWWSELDEFASAPGSSLPELQEHLSKVFCIPFDWSIDDLSSAPQLPDAVIPESGVIARVLPTKTKLLLAVDFNEPPRVIADALLHLCGHAELGHIRPGDAFGHWDTVETVSLDEAHRQWDRDVNALLNNYCQRPTVRKVTSIEECTPAEKAWLLLQGHIGHLVGEARTLHPHAENYQTAAYQRQAAQRLVSQLEDYAGAMLCDGVGLGKTYVATTVMVHYANAWRDRLAKLKQSAGEDPFRITVLAPNSVVSTWRREAIPPLATHGVPAATVRVLSHTKLSRILPSSAILEGKSEDLSDMEHLLLSDLVIVDEAHNFRSVAARRTLVLRDLLRLQPRKDITRKVLLLTATPVNNSLEDLRQQASLLFSKPLWFNDNQTAEGYRNRVPRDIEERMRKARAGKGGDVASSLIHGNSEGRFSIADSFRDDLQFGVQIPRIGDYLKEQEKLLQEQQQAVRASMMAKTRDPKSPQVRVASELLDRIVVQRSRKLCKQIEREQGSDIKLLFRPDAPPPEKLVYEDVYDDTRDVLAHFLPLFDVGKSEERGTRALSLKVYMWSDVRDGIRDASETTSVVGLQRVLVLKRLESSPVAFLITLLRLVALYAHRLQQLMNMCHELGDRKRAAELEQEVSQGLEQLDLVARDRLDLLITGKVSSSGAQEILERWSKAHTSSRPVADTDDSPLPQMELFEREDEQTLGLREQLTRLWALREDLEQDFQTLLAVAPGLADTVFGRFEREDWPRQFIAGGSSISWPTSATWGLRIVTDAKLKQLVARLLRARKDDQKAIVFSQFTDTLAYIESVFNATKAMERNEWRLALQALSLDVGATVSESDVKSFITRTAIVSGETEDRDAVINAFAPYYRLGPTAPNSPDPDMLDAETEAWRDGWIRALEYPRDVLLASDVLAEGVNLQDASLLINYDVHWNPVRMIQRAGRVDRRLNPAVEEAGSFPDLERLAAKLQKPVPRYWWHRHQDAAPLTVNLLLPDDLEAELQLRERIANKTLAIDFTLGLEQGTGAEAEWMEDYRYQGISALNAWQKDRAIERVAGYQERLRRLMSERGIASEWLAHWNGWLREKGANDDSPILAWARLGRKGGEPADYTRHLRPLVHNEIPHWLWTTAKPVKSMLNFWLALDGQTFPASSRTDLEWSEDASRPLSAEDLLGAAVQLIDAPSSDLEELGREVGRPIMQGAPAISAGFLGTEVDRRSIQVRGFRILQLKTLRPEEPLKAPEQQKKNVRDTLVQVSGHQQDTTAQ
ncbi:hypothetical protein C9993_02720 [Marinobacter sp. Z-F4-2]|nr:hypothetical protein C9993_02720 [Marinobacter sp. Z-F4-2]